MSIQKLKMFQIHAAFILYVNLPELYKYIYCWNLEDIHMHIHLFFIFLHYKRSLLLINFYIRFIKIFYLSFKNLPFKLS